VTSHIQIHGLDVSRRSLLGRATLFAAGGALVGSGLIAGAANATTKLSEKTVNYQNAPKGKAQCDNCIQWQSPSSCKLVDGTISPAGWCNIYAPKS
jgi:hypothetical protein